MLPDGDAAAAVKLAQSELHVKERHSTKHCHQQVGQQKGTWTNTRGKKSKGMHNAGKMATVLLTLNQIDLTSHHTQLLLQMDITHLAFPKPIGTYLNHSLVFYLIISY